jgi:hypothetical protein
MRSYFVEKALLQDPRQSVTLVVLPEQDAKKKKKEYTFSSLCTFQAK